MSSPDSRATAKACQQIVTLALSISSPTTLPTLSYQTPFAIPDSKFRLPPPPSIDPRLWEIGFKPSSHANISMAYNKAAYELRTFSEIKLHRAIVACEQINIRCGLSAYDSTSLCKATTDMYVRTLDKMANVIISLLQEHARKSWSGIPRSICYSRQSAFCTDRMDDLCTMHFTLPGQVALARNVPGQSASELFSSITSKDLGYSNMYTLIGGHKPRHDESPIYKLSSVDFMEGENDVCAVSPSGRRARAFPARYTHTREQSGHHLPSSSAAFFPSSRKNNFKRPVSPSQENIMSSLAKFCDLRVGKQAPGQDVRIRGSTFPSSIHPQETIPHRRGSSPCVSSAAPSTRCNISLASVVPSPSQNLRRKCKLLPKQTSSKANSVPLSSPIARSTLRSHPSPSAIDYFSASPSIALPLPSPCSSADQTRRRKTAPLPRRHPSSGLPRSSYHHSHPAPSDAPIPLWSSPPSLSLGRSSHTIPRTPSLVSLSSSRSVSPSLSIDELNTPPASPLTSAVDNLPEIATSQPSSVSQSKHACPADRSFATISSLPAIDLTLRASGFTPDPSIKVELP